MADDKEPMSEEEAAEDESEQGLVAKSFFQGKTLEVGKTCEIRIEAIYEDEVAFSYVPHKKSKDGKDKDSDDDDEKPKKRRRDRDDTDMMRESLSQMDMMAGPPPSMGGY